MGGPTMPFDCLRSLYAERSGHQHFFGSSETLIWVTCVFVVFLRELFLGSEITRKQKPRENGAFSFDQLIVRNADLMASSTADSRRNRNNTARRDLKRGDVHAMTER